MGCDMCVGFLYIWNGLDKEGFALSCLTFLSFLVFFLSVCGVFAEFSKGVLGNMIQAACNSIAIRRIQKMFSRLCFFVFL